MQKIFIVEDDDNIREMLVYALFSVGFETECCTDGEAFFAALKQTAPSLVLMDIMLPGEDGISLLKKLKQYENTKQIPVIMLTAKGTEIDRVKGLDLGADDYITKPFSIMEVISRVRAVLRRCGDRDSSSSEIKTGSIVLRGDQRLVLANNTEISLTYKEFELLHYLMINEGVVLTRSKLLEQVWGFDYSGESRTVDMHIKSLRQKLGEAGVIIKTVRNVGYKIGG
ncbi:MAG: response regulator transcription factor [Syntrophomonadaceae bacterium]|nr:response regulator transcription factor [Syntrophomonadaceae bacterium]